MFKLVLKGGGREYILTLYLLDNHDFSYANKPESEQTLNKGIQRINMWGNNTSPMTSSNSEFLSLGLLTCGARGCPMRCRGFRSIPGPHPLDTSTSPTPVVTSKNVSRLCQIATGLIISHEATAHTHTPETGRAHKHGGSPFPEIPVENMAERTGAFEEA